MAKIRSVIKNKLNEGNDCLLDYIPKQNKSAVCKAFSKVKKSILSLYDGSKKKH